MTTVLYVETSPTSTVGGSHHSLLQLVTGLDRTRYRPVVVFYAAHPLLDAFRAAGAEVVLAPSGLAGGGPRGPSLAREVLFLARAARRAGARLIHLNDGVTTNRAGIVAAGLLRIPCVCHERKIRRYTWLDRRLAPRIDALVAISDSVRGNVAGQGLRVRRLTRIHNALDPESVRPGEALEAVRARVGVAPGDPVIAVPGRLVDWKGQDVVIRAVALLRNRHPRLRCLLIGDAPEGSREYADGLRRLAAELGVEEHVVFTGFTARIGDLLQAADVVVHASTAPEPFGRVLLEAMALGKPIVASDAGGPREVVVPGETGVLVPPSRPDALAGALDALLRDPAGAREMGRAGRARLEERFGLAAHVRRVEAVYRSLAGGHA